MGQSVQRKQIQMNKRLTQQQARINMGAAHHLDLENGHWQACDFSDKSSDASFQSAKFHSFMDGQQDIFYDNVSQGSQMMR